MNKELVKKYVEDFILMHRQSETESTLFLSSSFCCCYALMSQEGRMNALMAIIGMAASVGMEQFEDGMDFAEFLSRDVLWPKKE